MSLKKLNKSFILQHGQSDCGIACLASVIRYHGGEESLDQIRLKSGTTKTGTTLLGLYQAASRLGFEAKGLEADGIENLHELTKPVILHVVLEGRLQHYLVFYGFEKDNLIIGDPAQGVDVWTREKVEEVWKSKALLKLTPNAEFKKTEQSVYRYEWIRKWIEEDFSILLAALFLGLMIAIFNLSTAVFTQKLVDVILPEKETGKLIIGLSLFGILLLIKSGLGYIRGDFLVSQSKDFNNRMIRYFFGSLIRLPKSFFDSKKSGEMIARMNDTRRIQVTVSSLAGNLLIEILVVVTSLAAIFIYSWQVGVLVSGLLPLFLLLHFRFNKPIITNQKEVMAKYGLNESNYIDIINGIAEVKSTAKQGFFEKITLAFYSGFQDSIFNLGKIQIRFSIFTELVTILLMISVIGFSSYLYIQGVLDLGVLIAIFSLAGSVGPSLTRVSLFNIQLQEAKVAFDRMQEFTSITSESQEGKLIKDEASNALAIKNLSFYYPGSLDLLKDINLEIKKGELRALFGESGEGKSTIIQLLQRFYEPTQGEILLDGQNILDFQLDDYRQVSAVVSQDTKLFNNYLLFNIGLSEDPDEYKRLIKWCEKIGFGTYFNKFPQGYMTLLGEEGANISGGQKQLVALARALYRQPRFLLLDESTSAMDRNTERFVMDLLQNQKEKMGILLVTHRIKTASKANWIYLLENGTISGFGSPKSLMNSKNLFSVEMSEINFH